MSEGFQIRDVSYLLSHQTLTVSVHPATDLLMLPSISTFIFTARQATFDNSFWHVNIVVGNCNRSDLHMVYGDVTVCTLPIQFE